MNGILAEVERLFADAHDQGKFNGVIVLAIEGQPVYTGVFGHADRSTGRKLTNNTAFNVASVAKTFISAAVLKLSERNMLKLDQPIAGWFPELPYTGVTLRHLLAHTSGIPNYIRPVRLGELGERWTMERRATNAEMIAEIARLYPQTEFAPGSANAYSNTGYLILGDLIRTVSGQPLERFMDELIFKPHGLSRTCMSHDVHRAERIDDYAIGRMQDDDGDYQLPHVIPGMGFCYTLDELQGDGNVHTNASDLLKWDQLLYSDKLLPQELLAEAHTPVVMSSGEAAPNGLGWFVRDCAGHGRCIEHSGYWPGYAAEFRRYIDAGRTLIMLTNEEFDSSHRVRSELADASEQRLLAL